MRFFILTLASLLSVAAFAGDKINNGGGLWACSANDVLQSAVLVDLYEASIEFDLKPIVPTAVEPLAIVHERLSYLSMELPALGQKLVPYLNEVLQKTRYINANLVPIDDSLHRVSPQASSCPLGKWEYVQFADFAEYNSNLSQVLIRKDLWESPVIAPLDKSALIWHEAVYRWLRVEYHDENSVRARQIVGYLYSQLPTVLMQQQIDSVLSESKKPPIPVEKKWMCMITNFHQSKYYSAYGDSNKEARVKTMQTCQANSSGTFCSEAEVRCDSFETSQESWSCEYKNNHTNQSYFAKGRSNIEAEYRVRTACAEAGNGFFCMSTNEISCEKN